MPNHYYTLEVLRDKHIWVLQLLFLAQVVLGFLFDPFSIIYWFLDSFIYINNLLVFIRGLIHALGDLGLGFELRLVNHLNLNDQTCKEKLSSV